MKHSLSITLAAALLLTGCPEPEPEPEPEPLDLVKAEAWARVDDPTLDAFADQRPAEAVCDDSGWSFDPFTDTIEIETEVCDYLTLAQTTLEPLAPGDLVTVEAFHDDLSAPIEPAQGYLGLALDGEIVWELDVPIPSDAAMIEESFTIARALEAGSAIQVHVHNHGPNTWELLTVTVTHAP